MASENVTITEDAYERVTRFKREDERFSDVIGRLTNAGVDPMALAGRWIGSGVAEAVEATRGEFDRDAEERRRELSRP